jgi:hypothetical protein
MPNKDEKDPTSEDLNGALSPTDPNPRRRYIFFWAFAAFTGAAIVAGWWQVTTLETPQWEVWVVDENGQPLEGMRVLMTYHNFSAESEGHSDELYTDATGHVVFPSRTIAVSPLNRVLAIMRSAQGGVHASFGPHASVFAFGRGREGYAVSLGMITDWTGKPYHETSRIVAEPQR